MVSMLSIRANVAARNAVTRMRRTRGLQAAIARGIGVAFTSVNAWDKVPQSRVFQVAKIMHMAPEELRPDIFIHDPERRQAAQAVVDATAKTPTKRRPKKLGKPKLTWEHVQMWHDVDTYSTNREAAQAISDSLHRRVSLRHCKYKLGPSGRTPVSVTLRAVAADRLKQRKEKTDDSEYLTTARRPDTQAEGRAERPADRRAH